MTVYGTLKDGTQVSFNVVNFNDFIQSSSEAELSYTELDSGNAGFCKKSDVVFTTVEVW